MSNNYTVRLQRCIKYTLLQESSAIQLLVDRRRFLRDDYSIVECKFCKGVTMQYGAMNFPVLPVLDEIDTIAGLGFDYIELAMDQPEAHYSNVSENHASIIKALKTHGMGLVCHMPTFVSTADLTDSIRRASITEVKRSMSVAADLGAMKIVMHPSMISGMGRHVPEKSRGYAFEFLSEMAELADRLSITICLENMMPHNGFGVEPDEMGVIFKILPSLRFTLDTGHANLHDQQGNRLIELVKRFGDKIDHVHLSDNRGEYDEHLSLGRGNINIHGLLHMLQSIGYDSTVTFEVFDDNRMMLLESREMVKQVLHRET